MMNGHRKTGKLYAGWWFQAWWWVKTDLFGGIDIHQPEILDLGTRVLTHNHMCFSMIYGIIFPIDELIFFKMVKTC